VSNDLIQIRLIGVPIAVQQQSSEYYDGLTREFELIRQSDTATETVPVRLLTLIDELSNRFDQFSERPRTVMEEAAESGGTTVDVLYELPADAPTAIQDLLRLLDEADDYCRAGKHLVTTAAPPVIVAYRHWFLGQFVEQPAGQPAKSWAEAQPEYAAMPPGAVADHANSTEPASAPPQPSSPSSGVVASDQANGWKTTIDGDAGTVALAGELDIALAPALRDHLNQLHSSGVRHFTVDTSELTFIDSVGLSVLLALYRRCREEGGTVKLVRVSPTLRRTLEISGLLEVLNVS
jgi:anti-anti-sigma factor